MPDEEIIYRFQLSRVLPVGYEATRVDHSAQRRSGGVAARGTRAERLYFNDTLQRRSKLVVFDLKGVEP
jgi:hypothetical protein